MPFKISLALLLAAACHAQTPVMSNCAATDYAVQSPSGAILLQGIEYSCVVTMSDGSYAEG